VSQASSADENVHARALKERQLAAEGVFLAVPPGGDAKDAQVQAIEESFAAMQTPPVHATKPELQAVEVMPILPDFARWPEAFVTVSFDHDPLSEVAYAAKAPHLRAAAARGAFMKSFMIAPEVEDPNEPPPPPERFIVYFAPTEATALQSADESAGAADTGESTHEWVREYTYRTMMSAESGEAAQTLVLYMGDGCASYVPLDRRFELRRRVTRGAAATESQLPRPSSVTMVTRQRTADEQAQADERLLALTNPVLERPATPVDDEDLEVAPEARGAQIARDIFGDSDDDDE